MKGEREEKSGRQGKDRGRMEREKRERDLEHKGDRTMDEISYPWSVPFDYFVGR